MKRAVFVTKVIAILVFACAVNSKAEKSPDIPASKFTSCSSKDHKQVVSTILPFSLERHGNQEKVPCTPKTGGFDEEGHTPDQSTWDEVNKRCILTKKYCFVGNVWIQIQEIKSDGEILKEEFSKIYKNERSLLLEKKITASVSALKESPNSTPKPAPKAEKNCDSDLVKKQLEIEAKEDLISKRHIQDLKQSVKEEEAKIKASLQAQANIANSNWTKGPEPTNQTKIEKE